MTNAFNNGIACGPAILSNKVNMIGVPTFANHEGVMSCMPPSKKPNWRKGNVQEGYSVSPVVSSTVDNLVLTRTTMTAVFSVWTMNKLKASFACCLVKLVYRSKLDMQRKTIRRIEFTLTTMHAATTAINCDMPYVTAKVWQLFVATKD